MKWRVGVEGDSWACGSYLILRCFCRGAYSLVYKTGDEIARGRTLAEAKKAAWLHRRDTAREC